MVSSGVKGVGLVLHHLLLGAEVGCTVAKAHGEDSVGIGGISSTRVLVKKWRSFLDVHTSSVIGLVRRIFLIWGIETLLSNTVGGGFH